MADVLRAARLDPLFLAAARVRLVEVSPPLRRLQAERLANANPQWTSSLDELPADAPLYC